MSTTLTFDESAAELILQSFGKDVDEEGYVIDPVTGERETTESGDEILKEDFAGVEKGSIIFLDDDFNSIVDHVKRQRKE